MNYEEIVEEIEAFQRNEIELVLNKLYEFLDAELACSSYKNHKEQLKSKLIGYCSYFDGLKDLKYISQQEYNGIFSCLLEISSYKSTIAQQEETE